MSVFLNLQLRVYTSIIYKHNGSCLYIITARLLNTNLLICSPVSALLMIFYLWEVFLVIFWVAVCSFLWFFFFWVWNWLLILMIFLHRSFSPQLMKPTAVAPPPPPPAHLSSVREGTCGLQLHKQLLGCDRAPRGSLLCNVFKCCVHNSTTIVN
jgi:hypothetical protein